MASEIYMAIITGLLGVVGFFLTRSFAALDKKRIRVSWRR